MQVYSPFSWFDHLWYRIYLEPWLKRGISRTPAHWPLCLLENLWATLLSKLGWCILSSSLRITIEAKRLAWQLGCYNKWPLKLVVFSVQWSSQQSQVWQVLQGKSLGRWESYSAHWNCKNLQTLFKTRVDVSRASHPIGKKQACRLRRRRLDLWARMMTLLG